MHLPLRKSIYHPEMAIVLPWEASTSREMLLADLLLS
jgi:hypothetical protein